MVKYGYCGNDSCSGIIAVSQREQELLLRPVEARANLSLVVIAQQRPVTGVKVEARDVAEAGMHLRMCSAAFMRRACC